MTPVLVCQSLHCTVSGEMEKKIPKGTKYEAQNHSNNNKSRKQIHRYCPSTFIVVAHLSHSVSLTPVDGASMSELYRVW